MSTCAQSFSGYFDGQGGNQLDKLSALLVKCSERVVADSKTRM